MDNQVTVGKRYDVQHCRKGYARVEVKEIDGEWISCIVVRGSFQGIHGGSYRGPGADIQIRDCFATFTPVDETR